MIGEPRHQYSKYFFTIPIVTIFFVSFGFVLHNGYAMGPSACYNQYNDPFISFIIDNGTQKFDALANPGATFNVNTFSGYNVTFVMQTPSTSSLGNTNPGDTWYDQDVNGFVEGACVYVTANQNVTISSQLSNPHAGGVYVQSVFWGTAASSGVSYNVQWVSPPSAPQNLQATIVSSSQINLSWSAPSTNGGSAITGYEIERSTDSGSTWFTLIPNTGSTGTTYNDTGLISNTSYTYRVSAINSVGTSAPSNIASATTQQAPTLSVSVIANKQSYLQNSTAFIKVSVSSGSSPTSGASVTLHVCAPNNSCLTKTATTNSNGATIFQIRIPPNAPIGTYTASATASLQGYASGNGKTTFQVT